MPDLFERFAAAANKGIKRLSVVNTKETAVKTPQQERDDIIAVWATEVPEEFFDWVEDRIRMAEDQEQIDIESHAEMAKAVGKRLAWYELKETFIRWREAFSAPEG